MNKNNFLQEMLVANCYSVKELKESKKPINYLYANNGVFEIRKNEIGEFPIKIKHDIQGSEDYTPTLKLNIPKIPKSELIKIQKFFKDVCIHYNNIEAIVQIFWDKKNKKYLTIALDQNGSGAHVRYYRDKELELSEDSILVMDIHSHDTMSAFFSGIDDHDEKETRLFGVIGKVTSLMEMRFRYGVAGKFVMLQESDIFSELKGSENTEYPKEWLDKIGSKPNPYLKPQYTMVKPKEPEIVISINTEPQKENMPKVRIEEVKPIGIKPPVEVKPIEKKTVESKPVEVKTTETEKSFFNKIKTFLKDLFK